MGTTVKETTVSFVRQLIPQHEVWCEPYFQMGEVFFNKIPSSKEIINDADNNIVNFYLMVRQRWQQLHFLMEGTLHCDFFSRLADTVSKDGQADNLHQAWAFWLKYQRAFVTPERWSVNDILAVDVPLDDSVQKKVLHLLSERLQHVYISNRNPLEVIKEADGEHTAFYFCPRSKKEMVMLEPMLQELKGRFILHYPEQKTLNRMRDKYSFYMDEDCVQAGVLTNFKRQHTLFDCIH